MIAQLQQQNEKRPYKSVEESVNRDIKSCFSLFQHKL